jgi:hypothetical protein
MSRSLTCLGRALTVALLLTAVGAGSAPAQQPRTTTFDPADDAPEEVAAPEAAAAPGDFKGMLRVCDQRLDACETDRIGVPCQVCGQRLDACETDRAGVPFLAAAYMALWAILLIFVAFVRRGQRQLQAEVDELRGRLERAGGGAA